mgnify:CR=1 FL=1
MHYCAFGKSETKYQHKMGSIDRIFSVYTMSVSNVMASQRVLITERS